MSTLSLPLYSDIDLSRVPAYSAEPQPCERRLVGPARQLARADFVKQSKSGGLSLRLRGQVDGDTIPVYSSQGSIEGIVEMVKPDGLAFVAVKIEGFLKLKEFAAGGTSTVKLCSESVMLWRRGVDAGACPLALPFSVPLPTTFVNEGISHPLPPTFATHLKGMPGFNANVDYNITAIVSKTKIVVLGIGATIVSTPFIYKPLTRPSIPLPPLLTPLSTAPGFRETAEWRAHESKILMRSPAANPESVKCKLYVPKSQVICLALPIPFHIAFIGSAKSLPTLLLHMPSPTGDAPRMASTSIQIARQATVNVKTEHLPEGTKMWRIFEIGKGVMHRTGHGADWATFSGELNVNPGEMVGGFDAGCLWVKDCILFTVTPTDMLKGPMGDMRLVIPIRLVTNPWTSEAPFE
ncbi:hypothetical protein BV25DRAFT_1800998 [Artomyces pyxidatus]|uniref:Uncharacterized protein n=1 Tax=Artomyces pyxidatus TaxID=48021 RepID=A0ACB8T6Q4_9AGAM|nr:hypothetical protein BV25DRAFT_1800998 [Artomyces pyxidatus]